jgi:hypothetical protein
VLGCSRFSEKLRSAEGIRLKRRDALLLPDLSAVSQRHRDPGRSRSGWAKASVGIVIARAPRPSCSGAGSRSGSGRGGWRRAGGADECQGARPREVWSGGAVMAVGAGGGGPGGVGALERARWMARTSRGSRTPEFPLDLADGLLCRWSRE